MLTEGTWGLCFHDLQLFSQSLVAKKAWHVLCNPYSLATRLLKGKYFHDGTFTEAVDKGGSSYLWTSV